MNKIFKYDATRNNYKYNNAYKFKMVNSQGYQLTGQTGNPFDYVEMQLKPGTCILDVMQITSRSK